MLLSCRVVVYGLTRESLSLGTHGFEKYVEGSLKRNRSSSSFKSYHSVLTAVIAIVWWIITDCTNAPTCPTALATPASAVSGCHYKPQTLGYLIALKWVWQVWMQSCCTRWVFMPPQTRSPEALCFRVASMYVRTSVLILSATAYPIDTTFSL